DASCASTSTRSPSSSTAKRSVVLSAAALGVAFTTPSAASMYSIGGAFGVPSLLCTMINRSPSRDMAYQGPEEKALFGTSTRLTASVSALNDVMFDDGCPTASQLRRSFVVLTPNPRASNAGSRRLCSGVVESTAYELGLASRTLTDAVSASGSLL